MLARKVQQPGALRSRPGHFLRGLEAPVVHYEDIAVSAGLTGVNVSGSESSKRYIVETTGNGVAVFDYDNDGLPDIFFVKCLAGWGKTILVDPLLSQSGGLGRFEDVTEKSGIRHTGWGTGSLHWGCSITRVSGFCL